MHGVRRKRLVAAVAPSPHPQRTKKPRGRRPMESRLKNVCMVQGEECFGSLSERRVCVLLSPGAALAEREAGGEERQKHGWNNDPPR